MIFLNIFCLLILDLLLRAINIRFLDLKSKNISTFSGCHVNLNIIWVLSWCTVWFSVIILYFIGPLWIYLFIKLKFLRNLSARNFLEEWLIIILFMLLIKLFNFIRLIFFKKYKFFFSDFTNLFWTKVRISWIDFIGPNTFCIFIAILLIFLVLITSNVNVFLHY